MLKKALAGVLTMSLVFSTGYFAEADVNKNAKICKQDYKMLKDYEKHGIKEIKEIDKKKMQLFKAICDLEINYQNGLKKLMGRSNLLKKRRY